MPDLVQQLRVALAAAADPERAPAMQRYMKSALPFYGVSNPDMRRIVRPIIKAHPLASALAWEAAVRRLWDEASQREERYAALELAGHRLYRAHQTPDAMGLYRHLVVTGAWWDLVDWVAPHLIGGILRTHPVTEGARMRSWADEDDLWLRRAAIVCQLGSKAATDTALLRDVLLLNLTDSTFGREFFIRKGIGWALRQYAYTDADWVRSFVFSHSSGLSPLSRREAMKHLSKDEIPSHSPDLTAL